MPLIASESLVAGSEHRITGVIRDRVAGVLTPLDLTGASVEIHAKFDEDDPVTWPAVVLVPATDGVYFYDTSDTDVPEGKEKAKLQAWVTIGSRTYKSKIVTREVIESLTTPP